MRLSSDLPAAVLLLATLLPGCGEPGGDFAKGQAAWDARDYAAARAEFEPLARQGDPNAQFYLGRMLERGYGTEADPATAVRYYEKAAAAGISEARNNLGVMYRDGAGVPQDLARARALFESAARLDNADAQLSLGALYATGMGVERDPVTAHAWYSLAAENGNEVAVRNREALEKEMSRGELARAGARMEELDRSIEDYDPGSDPLFAGMRASDENDDTDGDEDDEAGPEEGEEARSRPDEETQNAGLAPGYGPAARDNFSPAAIGTRSANDYVRLKVVRLMDNTGFAQPVEAARFLMPVDWRMEGGIQWSQSFGCLYMLVNAHFRFIAPDGITAMEVFPNYAWNWYDDPYQRQLAQQSAGMGAQRPCDTAPPAGAAEYIRNRLLPAFRRGAQVGQTVPLPEVAQASRASLQAYMQQAAAYGLQMDLRADAAKVRISYTLNGQPVEEWITATVQYNKQQTPSAAAAMQGGVGYSSTYTLVAVSQVGTRAPQGRLDALAPLFATMIASYRPNLQYTNAVSQVMANMGNTAIQGAADRSRIWTQASREISDIIRQGYDRQQQSQSRIADNWSQATRGVETYRDPSTNERVELSAGYQQAWSNGNGEYILSSSPNFDPNRVVQGNWTEMRRGE